MGTSSIKYADNASYMYRQAIPKRVTNPVIYGRFPKHVQKKSSVELLNKLLCSVLLWLVVLSLVSYYFVSDGQKTMNVLGREIIALSNENIELQNKIDNLNSFNKVDAIIQGSTMLDTAKQVIEIPAFSAAVPKIKNIPVNYNWSIGY